MREEAALAAAILANRKARRPTALATVVRVSSSAYRREGAKVAIDENGAATGMISGGCLEPEVAETAARVLQDGATEFRRFDLEDDALWGLGMGCGGTVDVLIEFIDEHPAWEHWLHCLSNGMTSVRAVVHGSPNASLQPGQWMLLTEGSALIGNIEDKFSATLAAAARRILASDHPTSQTQLIAGAEILFDVNLPPVEVILFGAGHDAVPVAALAVKLGLTVSVVDPRPNLANAERFPDSQIILAHPSEYPEKVRLGPRSYVAIMNHQLERDQAALLLALESDAPYIGVLGPRLRCSKLLDGLRKEGFQATPQQLARLRNPMGLDVGAEGPEEIAVSFLAELLAVRNRFSAGFLTERPGGIHSPRGR